MKLTMNLFQAGLVDVSVNLGRGQARVSQHFLDGAQIGPMTEEMRGKRMAQKMGPDFLFQPGQLHHLLHDLPDPGRGQLPPMLPEK